MPSVAITMIGPAMLGRRCRLTMPRSPTPTARAAATNWRFFMLSTSARTIRLVSNQLVRPRIRTRPTTPTSSHRATTTHENQEQTGHGQGAVDTAHEELIHESARQTGGQPDGRSQHDRNGDRQYCDAEGNPRSVQHTAQEIPAVEIGPEWMGQRGRLELLADEVDLRDGIVGRNDGSQGCDQGEEHDEGEPDACPPVAPHESERTAHATSRVRGSRT